MDKRQSLIYKKLSSYLLFIICFLLIAGCSRRFEPEPLQLSVKQNLALLQSDPQFVMYFNFKKMRETGFWQKFISDSLFSAERNFGSFLNTLKNATGASISNGIDELYFSNSWIGDNAMVVKGTFDRSRIDSYVNADSNYSKINYPGNILVYNRKPEHFYFYFRDDFTVCASNYLNQIESTFKIKDTSQAGLLTNSGAMRIIENIEYKDNLWMMSGQKMFIRGIFENFSELGKSGKEKIPEQPGQDSLIMQDTTKKEKFNLLSLYDKIEAVSFSLKMSKSLELVMQNECTDEDAAVKLKNKIDAIIALSKLSSQFAKNNNSAMLKVLDRIKLSVFDKTLLIEAKLDEDQITEIRKQKLF